MLKNLDRIRHPLLGLATAFLAVVAGVGTAWASAAGTIKGAVLDDSELSLPGVLLTLSSDKLIGGQQQYTSDAEGNFVFTELPPGLYKVQAQKAGFGPVTKSGVQVAVGRTTNVSIIMKYGGDTVIIEEKRKVVDTEEAARSTTFTKDYLAKVPSNRSYQGVIGQTAGVIGSGNSSSGGASGDENTWMLDGVNVTDPVTGTFSTNFNFDAIEEIQVVTGGYDPEYGNSLGGLYSVITKSGGNSLEILANADYSNGNWAPKLDARFAPDGTQLAPTGFDSSYQGGGVGITLSGPVVRDRVWFLASYQYERSLYTSVGIKNARDFDAHYFFAKLTMQPVSAHRFTLSLSVDPTTVDNIDQGDRYTLPEAQGRQMQGGYIVTGKWNWFLNEDTTLETTTSLQKSFLEISGVPCTHDAELGYNPCEPDEAENTIDYETPGRVGQYGAFNRDNFYVFQFDDRWHGEVATKFSVLNVDFLGKHDFKAGVEANYTAWNWIVGYTGNLVYFDLFENYSDPQTLKNFYWQESSGYTEFRASGLAAAAFVQDVYKPVSNLTFRYGLRYDRSVARDDAGRPIIDVGVFGPRAYAIWDPWGDEKTAISAGYGRFNDIGRLEITEYLSRSARGDKIVFGGAYDGTGNAASSVYAAYDTENTITYADDLSAPHSDEFTAGVVREVVTDVRASVKFTGKFTRNVYSFDETNLVYDEDGYSFIGASNGTADFNSYYRLRTPGIARRDYYQVDFNLGKAESKRWFADATYSYVSSRGTAQSALSAGLSNPSQVELSYGALGTDVNHQLKAAGYWELPTDPWTTTVGVSAQAFSGFPFSRYYWESGDTGGAGGGYGLLKEPAGEYGRTQPYWVLNVQVKQEIVVPKGKLNVRLDLANVTNNQYGTSYYSGYISAYDRYVIAYRQGAIAGTVAVGYEF